MTKHLSVNVSLSYANTILLYCDYSVVKTNIVSQNSLALNCFELSERLWTTVMYERAIYDANGSQPATACYYFG